MPFPQAQHWVVGRQEPTGEFTSEVVGLPSIRATAATREDSLERIRALLGKSHAAGELIAIDVPLGLGALTFSQFLDPNDPLEREFVEELRRQRRVDYVQSGGDA